MTKFLYNNAKNLSISHRFFELKCKYHLNDIFKDEVDLYLNSKLIDKLIQKLKKSITIS